MGLGKTLTIISLVLKHIQVQEENDGDSEDSDDDEENNNDEGWKSKGRKELRDGGEDFFSQF